MKNDSQFLSDTFSKSGILFGTSNYISRHVAHFSCGKPSVSAAARVNITKVHYRLGEFASRFHDAETQRNDFSREEEVDHLLLIRFDQSACGDDKEAA